MTDVELKKWAFEKLDGWGVLEPAEGEKPPKFRAWNLTERMAKADELVAWALSPGNAPAP
jgi:hypothetical protein